jgi:hypothetical protein
MSVHARAVTFQSICLADRGSVGDSLSPLVAKRRPVRLRARWGGWRGGQRGTATGGSQANGGGGPRQLGVGCSPPLLLQEPPRVKRLRELLHKLPVLAAERARRLVQPPLLTGRWFSVRLVWPVGGLIVAMGGAYFTQGWEGGGALAAQGAQLPFQLLVEGVLLPGALGVFRVGGEEAGLEPGGHCEGVVMGILLNAGELQGGRRTD